MNRLPIEHHNLSRAEGSDELPVRIADCVARAFHVAGVTDYALALSFNGKRAYYTAGDRRNKMEIRGRIQENDHLFIKSNFPRPEPTFFRYPRTGEPCLMFGNHTLKRLPIAWA